MKKYDNLDNLLISEESARIFFGSLPDYVRGAVIKHSTDINTEDELHTLADSVMHEFN